MLRVLLDEVQETFDGSEHYMYRGHPFTGVAFEDGRLFTSEYHYENGKYHGRSISTFRSGALMEESFHDHGRPIGESRTWFESGQLRHLHHHTPPELRRTWNEAGTLIYEVDAERVERRWFDSGGLRSIRRGDETCEFTIDGRLAFTWQPRTLGETIYAGCTFVDDVMDAELETLVDDHDRENHVFYWIHALLDKRRPDGVTALGRLLRHANLWTITMALRLVGTRNVHELEADVRSLRDDVRVPPRQRFEPRAGGITSRSATRSIGQVAATTLDKLAAGPTNGP